MATLQDWLGTFWRILVSPTPKTFIEEAEKAENKFASAISWSIFIAIYSYAVFAIAGYVFDFTVLILMTLVFPFLIVLVPSASHYVLQRIFHRKQYLYEKILYVFTAILVLFQLIINPVSLLLPTDIGAVAAYAVIAYQFILFVIAVKAIANVQSWQAITTVLASVLAGALIFICTLPFIASMIGGVNRTMR